MFSVDERWTYLSLISTEIRKKEWKNNIHRVLFPTQICKFQDTALEGVQRRWTKEIDLMHDLSYADRLRSLNLYSVQGRLVHADLLQCWKMFHGKVCINPDELFHHPPLDQTRDHSYRSFSIFTHTDIRKCFFFSVQCILVWNSLPADFVRAHSLNRFKGLLEVHAHHHLFAYVWVCSYH